MRTTSRFWADWTARDFAQAHAHGRMAQTIAVLPVAATEQHGPHLPLNVDTALVDGVIAAALPQLAADVPALFLPTQAVGLSPEHAAFAGTLTLKAETTLRLWTELAECVAAAGVRKLVEASSPDVRETAASLKVSAKALEKFLANPETERQLAEMPGAMQQARETVTELRSAARRLNAVLGRAEQLTSSQQANVEGVLEGARGLIENLKELTGEAKRYPSGVLFGPPPGKSRQCRRRPRPRQSPAPRRRSAGTGTPARSPMPSASRIRRFARARSSPWCWPSPPE